MMRNPPAYPDLPGVGRSGGWGGSGLNRDSRTVDWENPLHPRLKGKEEGSPNKLQESFNRPRELILRSIDLRARKAPVAPPIKKHTRVVRATPMEDFIPRFGIKTMDKTHDRTASLRPTARCLDVALLETRYDEIIPPERYMI